jgi:hypothetical protein
MIKKDPPILPSHERNTLWGILTGDKKHPVKYVPIRDLSTEEILKILNSLKGPSDHYKYLFQKELNLRRKT